MNVNHTCPAPGCGWMMTGAHDDPSITKEFQRHYHETHEKDWKKRFREAVGGQQVR